MTERLRSLVAPRGDDVPPDVETWLASLGGPVALRVAGRDRTRTRVVATLLHGNEPSGVRAVHAWLRGGTVPAVDVLVVLGAVAAARLPPGLAHRSLPGGRDLNRCFAPPWDGAEGALAREILDAVRAASPEALVDLHNNTGHNPAYGVGTRVELPYLNLVSLFAERFVLSTIRLGALVETFASELPAVTIECGRAGDPAADVVALAGLERFVERDRLETARPLGPMDLFTDPVRVRLRDGLRVAFGEGPVAEADLTLTSDLDRHNFETVPAGTALGWVADGGAWPIEARPADGHDVSHLLFGLEGDRLVTRTTIVPIMMTTDPAIAASDCLFYGVRMHRRGYKNCLRAIARPS